MLARNSPSFDRCTNKASSRKFERYILAGAVMMFLTVQEPTGTWAVFDTTVDAPADFAGTCLIGLTRDRAEWLAARANQDASVRSICRSSPLEPEQTLIPMRKACNDLDRRGPHVIAVLPTARPIVVRAS
ncbi:conserved hypothetical protein [Mesorhizobium sp. STM 4661]|nr:conserved hypothetical protein [Mesorhizobium sp. STM 4661]